MVLLANKNDVRHIRINPDTLIARNLSVNRLVCCVSVVQARCMMQIQTAARNGKHSMLENTTHTNHFSTLCRHVLVF
jgi:hypothetical protein